MRSRKKSVGELISSFVFFFVGLLALIHGKSLILSEEYLTAVFLYLAGGLSFIAAFRFQVQNLIDRYRAKK